jgi:aspartate racemase
MQLLLQILSRTTIVIMTYILFGAACMPNTIKEELGRGLVNVQTKKAYISIINDLVANGAEGIILGCIEIPMLISQDDVSVLEFDTTKIHSMAAVEFALSK